MPGMAVRFYPSYNAGWGWMSGSSQRPLIKSIPNMTATITMSISATMTMRVALKRRLSPSTVLG